MMLLKPQQLNNTFYEMHHIRGEFWAGFRWVSTTIPIAPFTKPNHAR